MNSQKRPATTSRFQNLLGPLCVLAIAYAARTTAVGQRWVTPKTVAYIGISLIVLGMSSAIIASRIG